MAKKVEAQGDGMEVTIMNKTMLISLAAVSVALGCGNGATPAPGASATTTQAAPNSVDEALADAETGVDPAGAQARLETLLADTTIKKEDHARLAIALSAIVEKAGDHERAVALTEDAVASGNEDAEKRLFVLLTGKETPSIYARRNYAAVVTPSARAFAKYYPAATPDRAVDVNIDMFGGADSPDGASAFDVASALREKAVADCGLCDEVKTKIHTGRSRESFWTAIPRYAPQLESSLVVLYVDAATIPPARYAKWLAVSTAAIEAAFARGEGLLAVKERPGAPPLVTIAAPRPSQLGMVEAKLAEMEKLPFAPTAVPLDAHLAPSEIQGAVRGRFGAFRACYESLLERRPGAAGTIELAYAIAGDGAARDVVVNLPPALDDAELSRCVKAAAERIVYPAWSVDPKATTTVKYPIVVSPGH